MLQISHPIQAYEGFGHQENASGRVGGKHHGARLRVGLCFGGSNAPRSVPFSLGCLRRLGGPQDTPLIEFGAPMGSLQALRMLPIRFKRVSIFVSDASAREEYLINSSTHNNIDVHPGISYKHSSAWCVVGKEVRCVSQYKRKAPLSTLCKSSKQHACSQSQIWILIYWHRTMTTTNM